MPYQSARRLSAADSWSVRLTGPSSVILAAALAASATLPAPALGQEVRPPAIEITAPEELAFDAAEVPAYQGEHPHIYAYIDENQVRNLENLRRWTRQPSISAEGRGIAEMAEMLREDLLALGFQEAELVPTSGHPGVWGFYDAGAERTLAVYMMYDVQPVEDEDWSVPPFTGAIVEHPLGRVLMDRGATNQKGPERAFLNALEAILAVEGTLPVNLMIVAEGEEELGSPNYAEVIERYEARLRGADGVFFPMNTQGRSGSVSMFLGVKGIVYFELEARGGEWGGPQRAEIHGSMQGVVDSPVWRLVQALASLTTPDGNTILVPGYYDAIRQPTDEEQRLYLGMLPTYREQAPLAARAMGIARPVHDMDPDATLARALFGTTLNINGISGGYAGPGVKTILPHRAVAKVDSRLVPDQTPDEALALIRRHLDENGFEEIEIRPLAGYPPAQTSVGAPLVRAAIAAYNKHGHSPTVAPRIQGSAPYHIFTQRLGLPMIAGGLGHGSGAHAPDEYMLIEPGTDVPIAGLAEIEKFYVDLLHALAAAGP